MRKLNHQKWKIRSHKRKRRSFLKRELELSIFLKRFFPRKDLIQRPLEHQTFLRRVLHQVKIMNFVLWPCHQLECKTKVLSLIKSSSNRFTTWELLLDSGPLHGNRFSPGFEHGLGLRRTRENGIIGAMS